MNAIQYFDWGGEILKNINIPLFAKYTDVSYKDIHIFQFHVYILKEDGNSIDSYREFAPVRIEYAESVQKLIEKIYPVMTYGRDQFKIKIAKIEWVLATKIDNYNAISGKIKAHINNETNYRHVIIEEKFRRDNYICFSIIVDMNSMLVKNFRSATLTI